MRRQARSRSHSDEPRRQSGRGRPLHVQVEKKVADRPTSPAPRPYVSAPHSLQMKMDAPLGPCYMSPAQCLQMSIDTALGL